VIVTRPHKVVTFEGTPTLRAIPETLGNQLSVLIQLYTYVATIPRYATATAFVKTPTRRAWHERHPVHCRPGARGRGSAAAEPSRLRRSQHAPAVIAGRRYPRAARLA
jgi:hypothetical protein